MTQERFCALCKCPEHSDMPKGLDKNWSCPLLGKKICEVCCEIELEGGLGAPDTLSTVCRMTGKTKLEVHETCVACPHGGKALTRPPKLISIRGKDGKQIKSGPEFEKAKRKNVEWFKDRLARLKEEKK